jgi:hypothetical protein
MAIAVYILCALTSTLSAVLLFRAYTRNRVKLLYWSGLCFAGLAANNILLIVDLKIFPEVDLSIVRSIPAVIGLALLLYGLIWDAS